MSSRPRGGQVGGEIRVLLAEDDSGFRNLVVDSLSEADERLVFEPVQNGREAIDAFEESSFDCVVSDYQMPRVDGLELLQYVHKRNPDIPFIIVTGHGDESLASEAVKSGAADYFRKDRASRDLDLLANSIRNAVDRRREQLARERTLEALHDGSRALLGAESIEEVCEIAVDAVENLLDLPLAGVYLWDDPSGELRPAAHSETATEVLDELPVFDGDDSLVWEAFVAGEPRRFRDVSTESKRHNDETAVETELILPLGNHGVIVAGSPESDAVDDGDFGSANVLATSVGSALDRAEREAAIREQERQLSEQNEQLERLNRLNGLIRETMQTLVSASTPEAVEEALCTHLTGVNRYRLAWVGSATDGLDIRQWSGTEPSYLDDLRTGDAAGSLPAARVEREGEPSVVPDVLTAENAPWREPALNHGLRSSITLPLRNGIRSYGVLEVHADQPGVFSDEERAVLEELAEMTAGVLATLDRERARSDGELTRVELAVEGPVGGVFSLAEQVGAELTVKRAHRNADDWTVGFRAAVDDPETVTAAAETLLGVKDVVLVNANDERPRYRATLSSFPTGELMADQGVELGELVVADGDAESRLSVVMPAGTDVRSLVEAYDEAIGSARLLSKSTLGGSDFGGFDPDQLTDRQREVLSHAVHGGYFEWPREATGEEIAESMDISPPTFHQHVRGGLKELLDTHFGE